MAKQVTLNSSGLTQVHIYKKNSNIWAEGDVLDDEGNVIATRASTYQVEDLPPQVRNAANTFMKLLSKVFNNEHADEDVETWEDV